MNQDLIDAAAEPYLRLLNEKAELVKALKQLLNECEMAGLPVSHESYVNARAVLDSVGEL